MKKCVFNERTLKLGRRVIFECGCSSRALRDSLKVSSLMVLNGSPFGDKVDISTSDHDKST